MKKTALYGHVCVCSVGCNSIDVDDILPIHEYLIKTTDKIKFGIIKRCLMNY